MGTIKKSNDEAKNIPVQSGAIGKILAKTGRMPPISMTVTPLETKKPVFFNRFLSYKYSDSILTPVNTFNFTALLTDSNVDNAKLIQDGDIVSLFGNNVQFGTGIIDSVEISTDADMSEKVEIAGRDLLGQYEDQDSVSIKSEIVVAKKFTLNQVIALLSKDTRIAGSSPILKGVKDVPMNYATQPGETKLAALQRHVESLNILFWMSPQGRIILGKPNFVQARKGRLFMSRATRESNVLSISVRRASTNIPNIMVPIFNGQEAVQNRLRPEQILYNTAQGPSRLRRLGHVLPKAVVISNPEGTNPQDIQDINFISAATKPGQANILQAYAKRELARKNKDEMVVQIQVYGHYNDNGEPWIVDTVYSIFYDRGGVDEDMYLYQVEYDFGEERSQITNLWFCKKHCLVSDLNVLKEPVTVDLRVANGTKGGNTV